MFPGMIMLILIARIVMKFLSSGKVYSSSRTISFMIDAVSAGMRFPVSGGSRGSVNQTNSPVYLLRLKVQRY